MWHAHCLCEHLHLSAYSWCLNGLGRLPYRPMTMDGFTKQVSVWFPELTTSIWPQTSKRDRLGSLGSKMCMGTHSPHPHTPIHTEAGNARVGGNVFSQPGFDLRTLGFEWKSDLSQFPLCSILVPHTGLPAMEEPVLASLPHMADALSGWELFLWGVMAGAGGMY